MRPGVPKRGDAKQLCEALPRLTSTSDPEAGKLLVDQCYRTVGQLLDDFEESALLVDPLCIDGRIIGASNGFLKLTGYDRQDVIGQNCRMMLDGVPEVAISRSSRKNIRDYCNMAKIIGLQDISEAHALQPNRRRDGSIYMNLFLMGVCTVHKYPLILGITQSMGEGIGCRIDRKSTETALEIARSKFKEIREHLRERMEPGSMPIPKGLPVAPPGACASDEEAPPDFRFFSGRLQDHCLLTNLGYTAMRREPEELSTNALVFSDRPVKHTEEGLSFMVRIDMTTPTFFGLPILGFTRRVPKDEPGLYPCVSRCMGASVLIGACGEAFARDKLEHFKMGFKKPAQEEVQTWDSQPTIPPQQRAPPVQPKPGDILRCVYTHSGSIKLLVNDAEVLSFDTGRPVDPGADYYAMIDVCLAVYRVTVLSSETRTGPVDFGCPPEAASPPLNAGATASLLRPELGPRIPDPPLQAFTPQFCQPTLGGFTRGATPMVPEGTADEEDAAGEASDRFDLPEDPLQVPLDQDMFGPVTRSFPRITTASIDAIVRDALVKKGVQDVTNLCNFCVTIADPRAQDCPLIAVSMEFERMTGFSRQEALGVNCRFLNEGCDISPDDLWKLRHSTETGAPFTGLLINRKKSGELFLNLLDLRGLTVARSRVSGKELWFLVGIQADVTDLAEGDVPENHLARMNSVATKIRASVSRELSEFARSGAAEVRVVSSKDDDDDYCLLDAPEWRTSTAGMPSDLSSNETSATPARKPADDSCTSTSSTKLQMRKKPNHLAKNFKTWQGTTRAHAAPFAVGAPAALVPPSVSKTGAPAPDSAPALGSSDGPPRPAASAAASAAAPSSQRQPPPVPEPVIDAGIVGGSGFRGEGGGARVPPTEEHWQEAAAPTASPLLTAAVCAAGLGALGIGVTFLRMRRQRLNI